MSEYYQIQPKQSPYIQSNTVKHYLTHDVYIDNKYYREQLVCNAKFHNCHTDNRIGDEGMQHLKLPANVQSVNLSCK